MKKPLRIFVVSSYSYWGERTPDDVYSMDKQIGGGETAMFSIAKGLAALGHTVFLFYGQKTLGRFSGVDVFPIELFVQMAGTIEHDVLLLWDASYALRYAIRSKVNILAFQLNDAFIGPFAHVIDGYAHPSEWHQKRFHELYPEMLLHKAISETQITNGVDYNLFDKVAYNPKRVIYTSSPDRGLHHLLRFWPEVVRRVPDAELHVFYEMQNWLNMIEEAVGNGFQVSTASIAEEIKQHLAKGLPNVQFRGAVGRGQLIQEQLHAGVFVYPCDPVQPTEGYSMSVHEAISAGCHAIISDADAFPELWRGAQNVEMLSLPIQDEQWVEAIVKALTDPQTIQMYRDPTRSWDYLAGEWDTFLRKVVNASKSTK